MKNLKKLKFTDGDFQMEVSVSPEEKTVWMSLSDLGILFEKSKSTILRYVKNIIQSEDSSSNRTIVKNSPTCSKLTLVQIEGERTVKRVIEHYNLDLILALGYALKSERGIKLKEFVEAGFPIENDNPNNVIIYNNGNINLSVNISPEEDTVWLTQSQIAELFETSRQNVSFHIQNISEEGELDCSVRKEYLHTESVSKKSLHTADDGKTYSVTFYNLDMILAVGYRVKSKRAAEFRRWATKVLKDYLIKGYALNEARLSSLEQAHISLVNDVEAIKKDVYEVKEIIEEKPIAEKIFYDGEYYDSYELLCSLVAKAKTKLLLIDPYFDSTGLKILKKVDKEVNIIVCLSKAARLSEDDINSFEKQYSKITVIKKELFHDRFLIIDDIEGYSLGASINYMGSKVFAINRLVDPSSVQLILNKVS